MHWSSNSNTLIDCLEQKCKFIRCLTVGPVATGNVLIANDCQLFAKNVSVEWLNDKLNEKYLDLGIGELREEVFHHTVRFLMKHRSLIKGYYFLDDSVPESDKVRVKALLNHKNYTSMHSVWYLIHNRQKNILELIPGMIFYCFVEVLSILLTDSSHGKFVESGVPYRGSFSKHDYIQITVVKRLLDQYVAESLGMDLQDVYQLTGLVGADI